MFNFNCTYDANSILLRVGVRMDGFGKLVFLEGGENEMREIIEHSVSAQTWPSLQILQFRLQLFILK